MMKHALFKGNKKLPSLMDKYIDDVELIDCPLCKHNNTKTVGFNSRGGIKVNTVICNTCTLIYLNPKPVPKKYSEFYSSGDYRRFLNIVKGRDNPEYIDNTFSDVRFQKRKEYGKQIAKKYFKEILTKDDLFFDFGCDYGGILAAVKEECSCSIMGNEPSEPCAEFIKEKLGISVLNCMMEDINREDRGKYKGKIKLTSIIATLEHVNNPVKCLEIAYDLLTDDGYLFVESMDVFNRMEGQIEAVDNVATIDHQYYFHKNVFEHMLQKCGFEIIRLNYDNNIRKTMLVLARKTASKAWQCNYDPQEVLQRVLQLNERACRYRNSYHFLMKESLRNMIRKTRRFAKKSLKGLV